MPPKNETLFKMARGCGKYLWFSYMELLSFALYNRYPSPRLLHLAKHGKNRRIRKKNIRRIMRGD